MADKSFGVKELNLISASGTPTITSPNSVNINATNVAISTDITVGGMVSLGAGTSISSPGSNVLTFGTNSTEKLRIDSTGSIFGGGSIITESDMNWTHDTYQRPHIFTGVTGGSPSDGVIVAASAETNPSNTRIGAFAFGCKTSSTTGVTNSGLKAFISVNTNANVSDAWKTGAYMIFHTRPDNGNVVERLRITSNGNIGMGGITSPSFTTGNGLHLGDNYAIGFGAGGNSRPDFQIVSDGSSLDFRCGFGADTADISMTTGGNLVFASGGGIDFSATGDANGMTSELLDDYEEGTWTPTIRLDGGTANGTTLTPTSTSFKGRYVKIGDMVFVEAYVRYNFSTLSGTWTTTAIEGLPYSQGNQSSQQYTSVHIGYLSNFYSGFPTTNNNFPAGYIRTGQTDLILTINNPNGAETTISNSVLSSNASAGIMFSAYYRDSASG